MVLPKLIVDLTRDNKVCTKCQYLSTDCWYDTAWWVCTHPKYKDTEVGCMDLEIPVSSRPIRPSWCPLENK